MAGSDSIFVKITVRMEDVLLSDCICGDDEIRIYFPLLVLLLEKNRYFCNLIL